MEAHNVNGVLVVNKHGGVTSHDIVGMIRRLYGTRQVGHTGTLDPMATGVLVMLVGNAAKAAEYLVAGKKRYICGLRLGITTDTEDTTGRTLSECGDIPSKDEVNAVIRRFFGEIEQIPPMYSALKVNGHKLVDLARRGESVERQPRRIRVYSITAKATENEREYILDVSCSSGTYIRTLCADIGKALGCGGAMYSLCRMSSGIFTVDRSHTINELEGMTQQEREALLIPTESLFTSLPEIRLEPFFERLARNGAEIYQKKIGAAFENGARVRICGFDGAFFALGQASEFPDGSALKIIKMFDTKGAAIKS